VNTLNCVIQVNGQLVNRTSHDDVAAAIREGCKLPLPVEKQEEEVQENSQEEEAKTVRKNKQLYF